MKYVSFCNKVSGSIHDNWCDTCCIGFATCNGLIKPLVMRYVEKQNVKYTRYCITILAVALGLVMPAAQADIVTYVGSGPSQDNNSTLAAQAIFEVINDQLIVTLTNTATLQNVPADVLTGLFFDIATASTLTPNSATLGFGSTVVNTVSQPLNGNVGGEWVYNGALPSAPNSAAFGIGSSGLGGTFGESDTNFNGPNLAGPTNVGGMEYGIVSDASGGNHPLTTNPFISDTVVFVLDINGFSFSASDISNVSFQYGTALDEPNNGGDCIDCGPPPPPPITEVPEPATATLLLIGAMGMGLRRFRKS